jgi:hypothetical protein
MSVSLPIQRFTVDRLSTPIGFMLIAVDGEARLRALDWSDYETRMHRLLRLHYGAGGVELIAGRAPDAVREPLELYLAAIFRPAKPPVTALWPQRSEDLPPSVR